MKCPFVYANGHRCSGSVWQARAYGKSRDGIVREEDIRKVRLWCSEKDDHAGAVSSSVAKERMEFYPDELVKAGIYNGAVALCENVETAPDLPPVLVWDGRPPEQREAEDLNNRVISLWPEEWNATCRMSESTARKHRRALRQRLISIDEKNARNASLQSAAKGPMSPPPC